MNKEEIEEYESPYCEVCGTCGYIECCGIDNFIENHIKGKTNCKNEEFIIEDLRWLNKRDKELFEENKQLKEKLEKAIEYINHVQSFGKSIRIPYVNGMDLLEILKGEK